MASFCCHFSCLTFVGIRAFFIGLSQISPFLYARLQTGRIMVWWCLSVRPGLRPPVFRTFLLHALTYWAEILHMTLFYCTTNQVRVLSICVNFCGSYAPFGTQITENTQFSVLFSYVLWHIELKFCTWLCFTEIHIKVECRQFASIKSWSYAPFGT